MNTVSQDGTEIKELQQADPDITTVSRPPVCQMRDSSRRFRKLLTDYPCLSVVDGLCETVTSSFTGEAQVK